MMPYDFLMSSKNDAYTVPKICFQKKNHDHVVLMKKVCFFFKNDAPRRSLNSFFLGFLLEFFPKMMLAQFPVFVFFFQDSRIG